MKGGFNSSFIETRTLEGDKFIRDLKVGDIVLSTLGYSKVKGIFQRTARFDEKVFNIYYHNKDREGVLDRISGDQVILVKRQGEKYLVDTQVKDLKSGQILWSKEGDVVIDQIERMETVNRFFYNIDIDGGYFYADNICIKSIRCKN